jgi:hypothetical protein
MIMKKSKFTAVALAAAIALSPVVASAQPVAAPGHVMGGATPWWMFVCPGGVVTAAVVKNWKRNKQLTTPEAWSCGFLYWWNEGTGQYGR